MPFALAAPDPLTGLPRLHLVPATQGPTGAGGPDLGSDAAVVEAHNALAAQPGGWAWRGSYNPATAYTARDVVGFAGSSYLATAPTTGVAPPTAPWALVAEAGQSFHTDVFQVTGGGQTAFTLNHHATLPGSATVAVNGVLGVNGVDFVIVGDLLTWLDADYQLGVGDILVAEYQ